VLGTGITTAPRFAAFLNGAAMHADNFDDTNPQPTPDRNGGIHASGAILPAALAIAERTEASGRDLMAAFHIGAEIACKLNHAIDQRHYMGGFHATSTLNTFGAAAACARLDGLDAGGIGNALAIAASSAAGIRRNFGFGIETTHAGHAAEAGLVAADLAARGLDGAPDALEAPAGYIDAAAGGFDETVVDGRLGAPWAILDPGTWIKPHPSGALTHPAMGGLGEIVRDNDLAPGDITRISARTNERVYKTLIQHDPVTSLQAKFSMEFCLAIVAVARRVGLSEFTDAVVTRADVRDMMGRVDYAPYRETRPDYGNVTTLLEVTLTDGRIIEARADHARGSTTSPMGYDETAEKFLGCADYAGWPGGRARAAVEMVAGLEDVANIGDLTGLLAG